MKKLRRFAKIIRPIQVGSAFCATWISAQLSNSYPAPRLWAAIAMGLACLAASLIHYGMADKMYARKFWDLVEIRRPKLLVSLGIVAFTAAILITDWLLPTGSVTIMWFTVVAIVLYGLVLSKHWFTKNITIALVCTTPIVMGWLVGRENNWLLVPTWFFVFFGYYAREVIKDIQDVEANCGIRVTLPLIYEDRERGKLIAARLAGLFSVLSMLGGILICFYSPPGIRLFLVSQAVGYMGSVALILLLRQGRAIKQSEMKMAARIITVTMSLVILAFV